jgi:hypothetical protein
MKDIDELNPILEIGAEGGSITVVSRPSPGGPPEYSVRIRDQTLTFLPTEEGGNQIRTQTAWSTDWNDVVNSLGRWPWPMLAPVRVDPAYAERVLAAAQQYRGRDGQPARPSSLERWARICGQRG